MNKEELITYLEGMEAAISTLEEIDVKGVLRIMGEVITVVELDLDVDKGWKPLSDLIPPAIEPSTPWKPTEGPGLKTYEGGLCPPSIWQVGNIKYGDDFEIEYNPHTKTSTCD